MMKKGLLDAGYDGEEVEAGGCCKTMVVEEWVVGCRGSGRRRSGWLVVEAMVKVEAMVMVEEMVMSEKELVDGGGGGDGGGVGDWWTCCRRVS